MSLARKLSTVLACVVLSGACAARPGPQFTAAQVRDDLAALDRALHDMPPDLGRTISSDQLARAVQDLDETLASSPPLDRDAAWRLLARLNPLLADGHLFVGFVDWRGDTRTHLATGGVLFPFEVRMSPACELRVRSDAGGGPSGYLDSSIRRVNGISTRTICDQLMARAHGDTREFRADLVSRRFWFYYWKVFGAPAGFEIEFDGDAGVRRIPGSAQLPRLLADEANFERQFQLQLFAAQSTAILRLGTFAWPDKQQLFEFTHACFATIRAQHVKTLVIDLRDNGGGDDESWIDGVMPYIASRPFRAASRYRKRVVVADPSRHETVGSVVDGVIDDWFPARLANPLRFKGRLFLAVGSGTYSSAVVMSNVIQDFGFGLVAGRGDSVRTQQSGGARRTTLPNSGLIVVAPRFVMTRPSGSRDPPYLTPDIPLEDSLTAEEIARRLGR
jgi:hypothetical protein